MSENPIFPKSEQDRLMTKYALSDEQRAERHKQTLRIILEELHKATKIAQDDGFVVKWTTSYAEFNAIRIDSIDLYRKY